jgi:hypothetical protein
MSQAVSSDRPAAEEAQPAPRRKKSSTVEDERPSSGGGINPAYLIAGGEAVIFGGAFFYLWQKISALEGKGDAPNREVRDLAAYVYNMESTHAEAIRKLHAEVQVSKKSLEDATKALEAQKIQMEAITKSHNLLASSFSSKPWERIHQPQVWEEEREPPRQRIHRQQPINHRQKEPIERRPQTQQNGQRYEEEEEYTSEEEVIRKPPPKEKRAPRPKPKESSIPIQEDTMTLAKKMMAEVKGSDGED